MRPFHVRDASWAALWLPSLKPAQNSGQLTATDKVLAGEQLQAWEQIKDAPVLVLQNGGGGGGFVVPPPVPSLPSPQQQLGL